MAEEEAEPKGKINCKKQYKQFVAGFAASFGGLNSGTVLGWPSPGIPLIHAMREKKGTTLSTEMESWIGGIMTLGAAFALIIVALIINKLGRKYTMISTVPLFVFGWLVLGLMDNDAAFLIARFVLGAAAGCFCVACPLYAGEISEVAVRGIMGVSFQLFVVHGILWSYLLALTDNYKMLCLLNLIVVAIFLVWMLFMPDSPYFLIRINALLLARASLEWLRAGDHDTEEELEKIKVVIAEGVARAGPVKDIFQNYANRRSFGIAMMLMLAQQLSGINCVIFNAESIFIDANAASGGFTAAYQTITLGVVQVIATLCAAILVERVGRRKLMMASLAAMCITLAALGLYFFLKETDKKVAAHIRWLPVLALCLYISAFSIGAGPIPWAMMGEIFPDEIKSPAACIACIVNWLLAFVVTKTYVNFKEVLTVAGTFWLYSTMCLIFSILIYFFMVETRGRTFLVIHAIMSGENPEMAPIGLRTKRKA